MLFALIGLMGAIPLVTRLLFEWRVRRLRADGVYPEAGRESADDVERLKRAGETVLAVRCYRAVHQVGLAEAHAAILGRPKQRPLPVIFFVALLHLVIVAYIITRR